jgi:hypothetical protein
MLGLKISRVLPHTEVTKLIAIDNLIMSIPSTLKDISTDGGAIATFPGMGECARLRHAVDRWNPSANGHSWLFVCGLHQAEKTAKRYTIEVLQDEYGLKDLDHVVTQVEAANTLEQAKWLVAEAKSRNIRSVALVAPAYHLPRVYCTVLRQCIAQEYRMVLIPEPVRGAPFDAVPELGGLGIEAHEMIPGEWRRVHDYQAKGDTASFLELIAYLRWLYHERGSLYGDE